MSFGAQVINFYLKTLRFNRMFVDMEASKGDKTRFKQIVVNARKLEDSKIPPKNKFKNHEVSCFIIDKHRTHLLKRKNSNGKLLIYFHGGAYVKGPMALQWKALSEIADCIPHDIAILDYPKTPEYTWRETVGYCMQVLDRILTEYREVDIEFLGDSAGGGLALSICMSLRDMGKPMPGKMILLSPWLDVSMSHKEIPDYEDKDLILTAGGLIECGLAYSGGIDTKDWRVSPLYGDFSGLPLTHVFVGGNELFYPDCRDFVKKAHKSGCMSIMHLYDDMQHDWPIMPMIKEAKQAREEIVKLIMA
jgi:acetyl esterase/lipase